MTYENTQADRIKLLQDAGVKCGDEAVLANGWKGYVRKMADGSVWVQAGPKNRLYQCAPQAVLKVREYLEKNHA